MPEEYRIDPAQGVIWSRFWGTMSDADFMTHHARLQADSQYDGNHHQLIDTTEVRSVTLSAQVVGEVANASRFSPDAKRAYLVTQDALFGLARMFQLYLNLKGEENIQVFRDRAQALAWLGVTQEPKADPDAPTARPQLRPFIPR
jgi:hypothetical protein